MHMKCYNFNYISVVCNSMASGTFTTLYNSVTIHFRTFFLSSQTEDSSLVMKIFWSQVASPQADLTAAGHLRHRAQPLSVPLKTHLPWEPYLTKQNVSYHVQHSPRESCPVIPCKTVTWNAWVSHSVAQFWSRQGPKKEDWDAMYMRLMARE